jgi:phosphoglycolate phosphatase-like HAD superfamily hydrolase
MPTTSRRPTHFILDFDGTITQSDTLDTLVSIAASSKPSFPTQERWKAVVDAYISDYTATLETLGPLPTTVEGEKKLLGDLKVVEQRSLDRVFKARIFEDVTRGVVEEGAERAVRGGELRLRDACVEFLKSVLASGEDTLHVLSVNWSRHFIASCFKAAGVLVDPAVILANELEGIEDGRPSTGEISPDGSMKIVTSGDKLRYLEQMRQQGNARIVYVGDSWPDIECLLAADVAICIRDEPVGSSQRKLAEALERIGVPCPRMLDHGGRGQSQVVWAKDFSEILKLME